MTTQLTKPLYTAKATATGGRDGQAVSDDGILDVIEIHASGPLSGLIAGLEALRQKNVGESHGGRAVRAQARRIRVATTPARLVEVDGNVVGHTPIKVKVVPRALTVIVPAKQASGDNE